MKPVTQEAATLCRCAVAFWQQADSEADRRAIMADFCRAMAKMGYSPDDLQQTILDAAKVRGDTQAITA
jgi:hypothetical protein